MYTLFTRPLLSGSTALPLVFPLFILLLLLSSGCASLQSSLAAIDKGNATAPVAMAEPDPGPDDPEATNTSARGKPREAAKVEPAILYEWNGEGRAVSRIVIDTNEQKARFYSGGEEIGWSFVATGISSYPTPVGRFAVMEKVENKRSNIYGKVVGQGGRVIKTNVQLGRDPIPPGGRFEGASMPFFMRLTHDGVGLHAGPIPRPGQPASHGCIRMPGKLAPVLYRHVTHGTEVAIVGKGPNYGNYVEKQRAIAAAERRRREEQRAAEAAAAATAPQAQPASATAPENVSVAAIPATGETTAPPPPTPPATGALPAVPATPPAVPAVPAVPTPEPPALQPVQPPAVPAVPVVPVPAAPAVMAPAMPAAPAPTPPAEPAAPPPSPAPSSPAPAPEPPAPAQPAAPDAGRAGG